MAVLSQYTPISHQDIVSELDELLALELDAMAAYDAAIVRLDDAVVAAQLAAFRADHDGRVQDLAMAVEALGGRARRPADIVEFATAGRVILGAVAGVPRVLQSMRDHAVEVLARYDLAVRRCGAASPTIKEMLARNLHEERRHLRWLDRRIAAPASELASS